VNFSLFQVQKLIFRTGRQENKEKHLFATLHLEFFCQSKLKIQTNLKIDFPYSPSSDCQMSDSIGRSDNATAPSPRHVPSQYRRPLSNEMPAEHTHHIFKYEDDFNSKTNMMRQHLGINFFPIKWPPPIS
jgi:hypothetical protein